MRKKARIMCDCTLFVAAIIVSLIYSISILVAMFFLVNEGSVAEPSEVIPIRLLFGVMLVGFLAAVIVSSPRYLCVLTLSKETITVWIPFHRQKTYNYKQFRYVYCGGYFHGNIVGMGKNVWYIVVSQRYLSEKELKQINNVPNSEEVVKVRYSQKNYNKLNAILPTGHIKQLECAIGKTGYGSAS